MAIPGAAPASRAQESERLLTHSVTRGDYRLLTALPSLAKCEETSAATHTNAISAMSNTG